MYCKDVVAPVWSPDGKWIAYLTGGRLRLNDPQGPQAERVEQTRDLGSFSASWGTIAWGPRSDGLVVTGLGFNARLLPAQWVPLAGPPHTLPQFRRAPAHLDLTHDGHAIWVEDNRLWRAPWS